MLALVLGGMLLWQGRGQWESREVTGENGARVPAEGPASERVSLTIDYGNGKQRTVEPQAWHEGMTVADLLSAAPGLATTQKGEGAGAFLIEVDGVANEGVDGNNWAYEVNGTSADRSFGIYELRPGDRVLWKFGPPR